MNKVEKTNSFTVRLAPPTLLGLKQVLCQQMKTADIRFGDDCE